MQVINGELPAAMFDGYPIFPRICDCPVVRRVADVIVRSSAGIDFKKAFYSLFLQFVLKYGLGQGRPANVSKANKKNFYFFCSILIHSQLKFFRCKNTAKGLRNKSF
jgi:hypothetical protein